MYIKRNGSKHILLTYFLIVILTLTSCAGMQDWGYKLPNGYEIWHINVNDICLVKTEGEFTKKKVHRYITEFCYNESYIGLKRIMIDESIPYGDVHIEEMDKTNVSYYLVNTENDDIIGPYTSEEYEAQIESLKIEKMCEWIKTVPKPKGATE